MRMFVMGGDNVDQGFLHPSPAICPHRQPLNLSRAPQRCQRSANTPRTIKAWRLWGQCMCAGCNGGLDGGKFNTLGGAGRATDFSDKLVTSRTCLCLVRHLVWP